jgi:hypothetical protein
VHTTTRGVKNPHQIIYDSKYELIPSLEEINHH